MIKNVFFDFNGTLIDDIDLTLDIENKLLVQRGLNAVTKEFYLDNNGKEKYIVESARVHKNMLIVKIKDLSDPDEALRLKNKDIFIPKENLEKLDEGTYYVFELIGLEVLDMDGNKIGTLNDVQNCSANDVYEILTLDNKKIYLPAIKDVIKKVDIAGRKMYVEIMKGLI